MNPAASKTFVRVRSESEYFPMLLLLHNYHRDITAAHLDNNKRNYDFSIAAICILTLF